MIAHSDHDDCCHWFFGSHGCDLSKGHISKHQCLVEESHHIWQVGDICYEWEPGDPLEFTI